MGPVPDNFNTFFEAIANDKAMDVKYQTFSDGGIGEKYIPLRGVNESLFTEDEIDTLTKVKEMLKDISTKDVINLSHQEKAWSKNKNNKTHPIDYIFAYELILL